MINWIRSLFNRSPPMMENEFKSNTKIWGILDGPYLAEDVIEDFEVVSEQYQDAAMLVCKVEDDSKIYVAEIWYQTLDEAYEVKRYFDTNIEPLEITHYD